MVLVMRPSKGSGVTACRSDKKLTNISVAPPEKQVNIKPNSTTPNEFTGATDNASQPTALTAMPATMVGPGPNLSDTRLP